ncbi:MAG: type II secretion system F family protein [Candidatus Norongarragalinales archaeon]
MFEHFYQKISSLAPRSASLKVKQLLVQGGFNDVSAREFIGFTLFFSFCVSLTVFFLSPFFIAGFLAPLAAVAAFVAMLALFWLFLTLNADSRAQKIESILPDVLEIISSNIRAGMTLENAVWSAARPEFGPLRDEIKLMSADVFGGKPITDAFIRMTKRVRSEVLERSVRLVVEGIRLGGEMARLLKAVAEDIRSNQALRREIATSTMMYTIFIVFAAVLAAPLLFAVSVYYSEMNESLLAKRAQETAGGAAVSSAVQKAGLAGMPVGGFVTPKGGAAPTITAREVNDFALACIFVTTLSAGFILGLIRFGKAVRGVKYVPLFVLGGLGVFFAVHSLLSTLFKTLVR